MGRPDECLATAARPCRSVVVPVAAAPPPGATILTAQRPVGFQVVVLGARIDLHTTIQPIKLRHVDAHSHRVAAPSVVPTQVTAFWCSPNGR